MAISPIDEVVNMVRRELSDVEGVSFKTSEIRSMLYNTLSYINSVLETSYGLSEDNTGTYFASAPSKGSYKYLIALGCAADLLTAEYSADVLGGDSGIVFKSGLSTYDSSGRGISFRDATTKKVDKFDKILEAILTGTDGSIGGLVGLYDTTTDNMVTVL
jgi:hypothetical protein